MTNVTPEMCQQINEMDDRGYFNSIIANDLDLSLQVVNYHVTGQCSCMDPEEAERQIKQVLE